MLLGLALFSNLANALRFTPGYRRTNERIRAPEHCERIVFKLHNTRAYRRVAGWRALCPAKGVTDQARPCAARG